MWEDESEHYLALKMGPGCLVLADTEEDGFKRPVEVVSGDNLPFLQRRIF